MSDNIICVSKSGLKGFIDFGGYTQTEKQKVDDFELNGDVYKLKTHNVITRLEKNGSLLFESVPGTQIENFNVTEKAVEFIACGFDDTKITMELEPETGYRIIIDGEGIGVAKSTLSGKINFSTDLNETAKTFRIEKV